jgi:hypothetical protein
VADNVALSGDLGTCCRVVEAPDQACCVGERLIRNRWIKVKRDMTRQETEHLASALVPAKVARGGVESAYVKVRQERAHEQRVRLDWSSHRLTDLDDARGDAPSCKRDLVRPSANVARRDDRYSCNPQSSTLAADRPREGESPRPS